MLVAIVIVPCGIDGGIPRSLDVCWVVFIRRDTYFCGDGYAYLGILENGSYYFGGTAMSQIDVMHGLEYFLMGK